MNEKKSLFAVLLQCELKGVKHLEKQDLRIIFRDSHDRSCPLTQVRNRSLASETSISRPSLCVQCYKLLLPLP